MQITKHREFRKAVPPQEVHWTVVLDDENIADCPTWNAAKAIRKTVEKDAKVSIGLVKQLAQPAIAGQEEVVDLRLVGPEVHVLLTALEDMGPAVPAALKDLRNALRERGNLPQGWSREYNTWRTPICPHP